MSKRQEAKKKKELDAYIEDLLHKRTSHLTGVIIQGYQDRLNSYLRERSPEFINGHVEYNKIKLELERDWVIPNDAQKMNIEKLRGIQLNDTQQIFKVVLRRSHYLDDRKISSYQTWGSSGLQTEQIPTKKQVETVTLESLIGFLAEKGIEYIEAERSTYRANNPKQSVSQTEEGESAQ